MEEILLRLQSLGEAKYADFQRKLNPGLAADVFLGIRVPALRKLAAEIKKEGLREAFLDELPHRYYDENLLHAVLLSGEKDYQQCMDRIEQFLPYIDNWAVCVSLRAKAFAKHHWELLPEAIRWTGSESAYTIRFGLDTLMSEFLAADFDPSQLELAASVASEDYYVRMMVAWYFATALAKQWKAAIPFLEQHRLGDWVHRKTIQKAIESFRLTEEQKEYLRSLR